MTIWQAVVLGVVQGLTEFLPVSSSGHLVITQEILGFGEPLLTFDIMVHLGTLLAVLVHYRKLLLSMLSRMFGADRAQALHLLLMIAIGTLPAVILGLAFKDHIEAAFGSPMFVAVMWFGFGCVALVSSRWMNGRRSLEEIGWKDAMQIGLAQSVAILPGVSRSGSTIIAGVSRGLTAEAAATYSFLLAIPAIGGAGILQLKEADLSGVLTDAPVLVGSIVSFVVGYAAISWLLKLLGRGVIKPFGIYCIVMSLATAGFLMLGGK